MATRRTLLAATITALVGATPALAVERHAATTGTGTACTAATPCTFVEAVNGAGDGDEVIVGPGTHTVATTAFVLAPNLVIRGAAGQPRPVIAWTGPLAGRPLSVVTTTQLRDLTFQGATSGTVGLVASNGAGAVGTVVDRVVIDQTGTGYGLVAAQWTVRNSAIRSTGHGAILSGAMTNTTILSSGTDTYGLRVSSGFDSVVTSLVVRNSIIRGGSGGGGWDIALDNAGQPGRTTTVDVDYSNYSPTRTLTTGAGTITLTPGAGNQTAAPVFAGSGLADFARQASSSPTIDAGNPASAGGTGDVDGDARAVGTVDIGADEYVPAPTAGTTTASAITATSATLSGTFDTFTRAGTARFEYGTTTAYGQATADQPVTGASSAGAAVSGLAPSTTYHARLVVTTDRGTNAGPDVTFTTTAAPITLAPVTLGRMTVTPSPLRSGRLANARFSLSRSARVTMRIERLASGRLRSGTCNLTARTGTRCAKWVLRGTIARNLNGATSATFRIPAKVGTRALAPGRYRLTVTARAADGVTANARRVIVVVR